MIRDVNGREMVRLGGDVVHERKVYGDVVAEFAWPGDEPGMILYRAVPVEKTGAFIVEMKDAHLYGQANGYPTPTLVRDAMRAAEAIGLGVDRAGAFKMADVILDGLPILLGMPPRPPEACKPNKLARAVESGALSVSIGGKQVL
jgi:hypothetical protein